MMTIRLPVPPSINAAYGNNKFAASLSKGKARGRYKTRSYKAWEKAADGFLLMQCMPLAMFRTRGPYEVKIRLPKIRGDIDNRCKPTMDFLVSRALTDDDRFARKVSIEVDPSLGRVDYCEVDISNAS